MQTQNRIHTQETIDLLELLTVLRLRIGWIIIGGLVCAILGFGYTAKFVTPMYQASIRMIVNSKTDAYTTISINDVNTSEELVSTYAAVIKSNRVMDSVIEQLKLNMSWVELNNMVSVQQIEDTTVMNIVVTCDDPEKARKIVNTISEVSPELIVDAVEAGSCKVISDAYSSGTPVSPNIKKNTMMGFLFGICLVAGIFILLHLLNDSIDSEEKLQEAAGVPVLSTIPMEADNAPSGEHSRKRRRS